MTRVGKSSALLLFSFGLGFFFISLWQARPKKISAHYRFSIKADSLEKRLLLEGQRPIDSLTSQERLELAELFFRSGKKNLDRKHIEKSKQLTESLLHEYKTPGALLLFAQILDYEHDFERSKQYALLSYQEKASSSALQLLVGAYLAQGNLIEASRLADRAVNLAPLSSAYLMRALTYWKQGRIEESFFDWRRAFEVEDMGDPELAVKLRSLFGKFLFEQKEFSQARNSLDEALRIDPHSALAHLVLSEGLLETEPKKALEYSEKGFSLSKDPKFLLFEAQAKRKLKRDYFPILAAAQKLLEEDSKSSLFHPRDLAEVLAEKGDPQSLNGALTLIQRDLSSRKTADNYLLLSKIFQSQKEFDKAKESAFEALRLGSKNKKIYEQLAQIEQQLGNRPRQEFYQGLAG